MIYQLTSAKEVIARVDNKFDIDHADWLPRAPIWIANALDEMQLGAAYEQAPPLDVPVVGFIAALPDEMPSDIKTLDAIEYDGKVLRRLDSINPANNKTLYNKEQSSETYSLLNGYIQTSFEEGTVTFHYKRLPIEYDVQDQMYYPKVPVNSKIQEAIAWYIMYSILLRGHKHPVFSLESNNPRTNPYDMWEITKVKGMNSAAAMDPEERANISRTIQTFIHNFDEVTTQQFRTKTDV